MTEPDVLVKLPCQKCGELIDTLWTLDGALHPGDFTLIACWIFHNKCWDEVYTKYPMRKLELLDTEFLAIDHQEDDDATF